MTWADIQGGSVLGVVTLRFPVHIRYISPGQRHCFHWGEYAALALVLVKALLRGHLVELGGIESLGIVWLGVDLCCSVVVSCDDAV